MTTAHGGQRAPGAPRAPRTELGLTERRPSRGRGALLLVLITTLFLSVPLSGLSGASAASDARMTSLVQATSSPPSSPEASPAPDAPRLTLDFVELNDSGVRGEVTLYAIGDRTIVQIAVENVAGNHPAHIHTGTCDDIEPEPAFPLTNVDAEGRSVGVVDVALDTLLTDPYVVDIHLSPTELGTLIACAEIIGEPTTPAVSPAAIATTTATATATTTPTNTPSPTPTNTPAPTATNTPPPTAEPTAPPPDDGTGGLQVIPAEATETPTATEEAVFDDDTPAAEAEAQTEETKTPAAEPTAIPTTDATSDGTGGAAVTGAADAGKGDPIGDGTDGPDTTGTTGTGGVSTGAGEIDLDGVGGRATIDVEAIPSGKGTAVGANTRTDTSLAAVTLPRQAGVGTAIPQPANPLGAAIWVSGLFALVLGTAGVIIRRGERARR